MDQQTNQKYMNWIKSTLGLLYVKEGLVDFSNESVNQLHEEIVKKITTDKAIAISNKCSDCSYSDIVQVKDKKDRRWKLTLNCKSNVCNIWLFEILRYHVHSPHPNEAWVPKLWPRDPWEVAKVFQGPGCEQHKMAEDSDCSGLLTLIQDCTYLNKFVSNRNLLQEVKLCRNQTMHSGRLEVEKDDLEMWLDTMIALLEDPKHFRNNGACQRAVAEIKMLRDTDLQLSVLQELEEKALTERITALEHDVAEHSAELEQLRRDISDVCGNQDSTMEDHRSLQQQVGALQASIAQIIQENQILTRSLEDKNVPLVEEAITDLTTKLGHLASGCKDDTGKIEGRLEEMENRMHSIVERQHSLEESVQFEIQKLRKTNSNPVIEIQQHLLSLYGKHCQKIPIYPLKPTLKKEIKSLYVKPWLKVIDPRGRCLYTSVNDRKSNEVCSSAHRLVEDRISTGKDMFYADGKLFQDIYVIGEAGVGKSTLCEHLVSMWCRTHSVDECAVTEKSFMEEFTLLFYISLKEVDKSLADCDHIVTMIKSQLLIEDVNISEILIKQNCLVLLDGLDEWCPRDATKYGRFEVKGVPRRQHSNKCTVLTTSRPWKIEVIGPELEDQIDRLLLLTGLENDGADKLAENVIHLLNEEYNRNKSSKDFIRDMQVKYLSQFIQTPVLLMQMACLWYIGKSFGNSQTEIYIHMIDKQFQIAEVSRSLPGLIVPGQMEIVWQADILNLLKDTPHCSKYQKLLWKLSKVAFETLFTNKRESSLVFDHRQTELLGMTPEEIEICLNVGLLTQSRVYGEITDELKTISFIHKTHQEFFAALFLANQHDNSMMSQVFGETIHSLDLVFQLEKVLVFISGLNPDLGYIISRYIMKIVSQDERVHAYRNNWKGFRSRHYNLIVKIQNMLLCCLDESHKRDFTTFKLELQDVDLDETNYANLLALWDSIDATNAKSVRIVTPFNATIERKEHWDDMLLRWSSSSLQKIHICDFGHCIRAGSLYQVLIGAKTTMESFGLRNLDLTYLGNRLMQMLALPKLASFGLLTGVKVTHEQLDNLTNMWSVTSQIQEFCLQGLECTTHKYGSCKYSLEMSTHKGLRKLRLRWINAANIDFDARELISFKLGWMYIPGAAKSALTCLQQNALKLEVLFCGGLRHSKDIDAIVDTLSSGLFGLKILRINDIDFGNRQDVKLSTEMNMLETVRLGVNYYGGIVITNKALKSLIDSLPQHKVEVKLGGVTIKVEMAEECVVEFVRRSANFKVTVDSVTPPRSATLVKTKWHVREFIFYTMKQA